MVGASLLQNRRRIHHSGGERRGGEVRNALDSHALQDVVLQGVLSSKIFFSSFSSPSSLQCRANENTNHAFRHGSVGVFLCVEANRMKSAFHG